MSNKRKLQRHSLLHNDTVERNSPPPRQHESKEYEGLVNYTSVPISTFITNFDSEPKRRLHNRDDFIEDRVLIPHMKQFSNSKLRNNMKQTMTFDSSTTDFLFKSIAKKTLMKALHHISRKHLIRTFKQQSASETQMFGKPQGGS
mmetsp:Transcript_33419/g.38382  ORF Transcript_33419/g.38382 Transcript_33419/m.38382 type:complete len:145 (+) Transcript_33419:632-1066(+)